MVFRLRARLLSAAAVSVASLLRPPHREVETCPGAAGRVVLPILSLDTGTFMQIVTCARELGLVGGYGSIASGVREDQVEMELVHGSTPHALTSIVFLHRELHLGTGDAVVVELGISCDLGRGLISRFQLELVDLAADSKSATSGSG